MSRLLLVTTLFASTCVGGVQSAPWFSSLYTSANEREEDVSSLVSPIINRELEASVVAHSWPSNPQSVFCEAYAYHATTYSDEGPRQELTREEEEAALALNHAFLNAVSDQVLLLRDDDEVTLDSFDAAKAIVMKASSSNSLLSPSSRALMEYSLAMRVYSPLCELHRGLARESLQQSGALQTFAVDQNAFAVVYPGGHFVSEEQILNTKDWTSFSHNVTTNAADRSLLLPGEIPFGKKTTSTHDNDDDASGTPAEQLLILYANLGSSAFAKAYKTLFEESMHGNIRFVVRHLGAVHYEELGSDSITKPTVLQGYGVRLDIRNVEYKVFDDRKTDAGSSENDGGLLNLTASEDDLKAPPQYIAGVNFSALGLDVRDDPAAQEGDNTTNLLKDLWKKHEAQQAQLIPPTWQRRKLPLQATSAIALSKDPLMTLEEISLNLPSVASMLVHAKIPPEIEDIAEKLEQDLAGAKTSSGTLLINGRRVSIDRPTFNVFELLNILRKEQSALEGLKKELGPYLKNPKTLNKVKNAWSMGADFLRLEATAKEQNEFESELDSSPVSRIDVGRGWKKAVIYVNDIEKDEKYAQWPRSVRQVFMAMQFGMPPSIRRNLLTILAVLDPMKETQNVGMLLANQLMQSNYPARLGVLLVDDNDVRACAEWVDANPSSADGEACPVIEGAVLDSAMTVADKDKLKEIPGTTRALHLLVTDLMSKYSGDLVDAYLTYVFKSLGDKKEMSSDSAVSMYDVIQAHADTMQGMQMGRISVHWSEAVELLTEGEDEDGDEDDATRPSYSKALRFAVDKGLKSGMSFINGRPLPEGEPNDVMEKAGSILNDELSHVFGLIQKGDIKDNSPKSVYAFFLSGKGVYKKVHPLLMDSKDKADSYVKIPHNFGSESLLFPSNAGDKIDAVFTVDAVLDVSSSKGLQLAKSILSVASSFPSSISQPGNKTIDVKVGYRFIPSKASDEARALCPFFANAGKLGAKSLLSVLETASSGTGALRTDELMNSIEGLDDELSHKMKDDLISGPCAKLTSFDVLSEDNLIVSNGMYYALEGHSVSQDDLELLISLELDYSKAVTTYLANEISPQTPEGCDSIARSITFLAMESATAQFDRVGLDEEIIKLERTYEIEKNPLRFSWNEDNSEELQLKVTAIVDPATELSQRLSPLLRVMRDTLKLPTSLLLTPRTMIEADAKVPITSFYRFVADPTASQDTSPPKAHFSNLPIEHTLTLRLDVPEPWDVQQSDVVQDTDNLRCDVRLGCSDDAHMGTQDDTIPVQDRLHVTRAEYGLNSLLVFGQCYETKGSSPNGLQLTLTRKKDLQLKHSSSVQDIEVGADGTIKTDSPSSFTEETPAPYSDTLVMKNVGYWQLRANPGVWNLQIAKDSKGAEIFDIVDGSVRRGQLKVRGRLADNSTKPVVMKDFINRGELLLVDRRKGYETAKLFASGSLQSSNDDDEVINVFSLATGHLYERFLKIMMLSVTKRTSTKVKFWFFENFLSPSFKASARYMAEKIGCEVEFVTYKWPEWLRGQTEKQRIIWGYKILFLDVLFPLNVKKIIYVDADQVVRGDLKELWDMDLEGAPYGYTPMCSSRESTLGFQFWRGGFWESHLQGRPYHISALYVVDLERFRKQLVGDQLRSIYQQLSADPNSLANLDQDLPNYAQHQVPIFSLPQEWLWCESWCSDETKAEAKTIDLCNNPLHKEPKVSMAKRVISGPLFKESWEELNEEVESYQQEWLATTKLS